MLPFEDEAIEAIPQVSSKARPPRKTRSRASTPKAAGPEVDQGDIVTSRFATFKKIAHGGLYVPVAISCGVPAWFHGERLMDLAPTHEMVHKIKDWDQYDEMYFDILDELDPDEILSRLTANGTRKAAMLCWCSTDLCCHRRYAAEWLEHHCEIVVPEWGIARSETETMLDWKDRE